MALRVDRSKSNKSSSASSCDTAMLMAEGTRPNLRAAAEKEPLSTTARKTFSDSLVNAMVVVRFSDDDRLYLSGLLA
jgi:hypothetical protein